MDRHTAFALLAVIAALAIWLSWRRQRQAGALLRNWADANGLRILHKRYGAPLSMIFTSGKYQVVYRVSVLDEATHRIREGWVVLGTPVWGTMNPDAVEVRWKGGP